MTKQIKFERSTKDYSATVDGILIGYFANYTEAQSACDAYVFETLKRAA